MPQDRRTNRFKNDRAARLDHGVPGELMGDEDTIVQPTTKNVTPVNCIWCNFPLAGIRAICPHCMNCQSCGMNQPQGGLDMCYLCGNKVAEEKVPDAVPQFRRMRGKRGLDRGSRTDVKLNRFKGRKQKP